MRPDAGTVVDQLGHELRTARLLLVAYDLVDIQHRRTPVVRVGVLEVRMLAFADEEVQDAVLVDVGRTRRCDCVEVQPRCSAVFHGTAGELDEAFRYLD